MGDLFRHTCLLLQAMKHRCWILLMWWKPVSLSDHVWVSLADTENGKVHCFFCISQAKQVEMRTVGCVFLVKMCIYNVISGWHFFISGSSLLKNNPTVFLHIKSRQFFFMQTLDCSLFLWVLLVQFYMGLPDYSTSCYYTHAFYQCTCLCFCSAPHPCSKIDFFRLSHHTVSAAREAGSACCHGTAWMLCSDKQCSVTLGKERCYCLDCPANVQTRVRVSASVQLFLPP